jgi:predicted transcriptional regulator of viral defense system
MEYQNLQQLQEKLFFSAGDVAELVHIKSASAYVLCSRYVRKGIFVRLKKDFYVLDRNWERYTEHDFFRIANFLQVPSYISCLSAMSFHGLTTQVPRNWFESVSLKRTTRINARDKVFHYFKLKKTCYSGFEKMGDIFIATKEKALADACHFSAFGSYAVDWSAIDVNAVDKSMMAQISDAFPARTIRIIRDVCRI